ncbi:hypothetical protein A5634_10415 [Mycobacterium asiaticum]|uniref:PPM-type phosphatase domain-containing protein n=1 Tax=Mycobacterium asiaticum TaxID=1790 RepID=A0A1A3NLP3_MYCAS|nr:protein phosphatase 2C domain-containing protein [Mycobacterium asiaticum]OBK21277.1 hypothetical protein A5634_10415 [Mycobacterium asiaticum]
MHVTQYSALSDVGCERSDNQDRWGADVDQRLFMVADGVGGSRDGALAAQAMIDSLPRYVAHLLPADQRGEPDAAERLGRAISRLSDDLHTKSQTDERLAGANSTMVAVVVASSRALVAHLGDSRGYLFRGGELQQLTRDHTLVQSLVDAQQIEPEDAGGYRVRNVVTRYMGMKPPANADSSALDLQAGDRLLLCSDGLHGVVDQDTLTRILAKHNDPGEACAVLIEAAKAAGAPDNVTALVIDISGD